MNPLMRMKDYLEESLLGWQLAYHGALYETSGGRPERLEKLERAAGRVEDLIVRRVRSNTIDSKVIDAREEFYLRRFRNWLERKTAPAKREYIYGPEVRE